MYHLDPNRLEDVLTDWERIMRSLRAAPVQNPTVLSPPPDVARLSDGFLPHFRRLLSPLDHSRAAPALPAEEMLLRQLPRRAGFACIAFQLFDEAGELLHLHHMLALRPWPRSMPGRAPTADAPLSGDFTQLGGCPPGSKPQL